MGEGQNRIQFVFCMAVMISSAHVDALTVRRVVNLHSFLEVANHIVCCAFTHGYQIMCVRLDCSAGHMFHGLTNGVQYTCM